MGADIHDPDPKLPEPDPDPTEAEPRYPLLNPDEPGPDVINPADPGRPVQPDYDGTLGGPALR